VSPREVENAVCSLAGVRLAAVVGVPDPVLGEAIKAYVVRNAGSAITERDVIRHCLARLESFMAPKHVEFVEELPVTDTGKVKKTALGATSKGDTVGADRVEGSPVPARKLLRGR